jgi:CSLREA domain-containing protein
MTIRFHAKFSSFGKLFSGALLLTVLGLALPALASAAAWTVNSTGDQPDASLGNNTCATAGGQCTLRAAIEESNHEGGSEEIFFGSSFNGGSGSTIVLGSALPAFAPEVGEINGIEAGACTTAAGVSGPCVEIDGAGGAKTLSSASTGQVTVKGLSLTGGTVGLEAAANGPIYVEEDWIGQKLDGTAAPASSIGVNVTNEGRIIDNVITGGVYGIHTSGTDPQGNSIRLNAISGASGAGILIENGLNNVFGNQIGGSGVGIRVRDSAVAADENTIGGQGFAPVDLDVNRISNSTGPAIELNTASTSTSNRVLRNSGSGNGGPFISLVKKQSSETKGPNNGIQPPTISAASLTGASGTAEPESFVRVYANVGTSEGEMGTFLGLAEAAPGTGAWTLTYAAPAATVKVAASQTAEEDERGSSALAFDTLPQFSLKVAKAGTGAGTVVSAPTRIECGSTCEAGFAQGGLVKLLGTAAAGSTAVTWAGCDAVNAGNECEVTMSAAKAVTATFELIPSSGGGGDTGGTTGGGGSTGGGGGTGGGGSTTPTKPAPKKKPVQCKAGFKKKTVKGKTSCVKVKKHKKKKGH